MSLRGRGGGRSGPWPGRGPFSYLPPWQRPGWLYGRGACWWLYNPNFQTTLPTIPERTDSPPSVPKTQFPPTTAVPPAGPITPFAPLLTKEEEIQMLEQYAGNLEAQLNDVKKRLENLSK